MPPIELLAPAGSPASALAALDAGADAIYAGLAKFNARERGENFSCEQMSAMIDHFHKYGKKVYVTFNTLIKESELAEAAETLARLSDLGPDALIVQDPGIIRLAREYFPRLRLHGSTQMGFHNLPGLELAGQMGLKRVILERQCTFDELRHLSAATPLELEVFVHGALCCSLSGQCLFSSIQGGHSGNRGRCKQPCRRRFYSSRGNGFFFSLQDLCLIDRLNDLKSMNIASLKIEGRLRQPDYVYNVVSAYRSLLDADDSGSRKLLGEARNTLAKSCGRKWSGGFESPSAFKTLVASSSLGASGMLSGTVEELDERGFGFATTKRLHLGDRLRVQPPGGDDGPAMTLTKMFVEGMGVTTARPGDKVFVCCDKEIPFRGLVYKIGESFKDYSAQLAALPPPKTPLKLHIAVAADRIEVKTVNAPLDVWTKTTDFQPAAKHPAVPEDVAAEFSAPDSEVFRVAEVQVEIAGKLFIPAAVLKQLRREFFAFLKVGLKPECVFKDSAEGLTRFALDYRKLAPMYTLPERTTETVWVRPGGAMPAKKTARIAESIFDLSKMAQEAVLPEFTPDDRLETLRKAVQRAVDAGVRRFRIRSLFEFGLFADCPDVILTSSAPLGVCNSLAALELRDLGASAIQAQLELEKPAIEALAAKSPIPVEVYRFGRPVLLVTRALIPAEGAIKDARGNRFIVKSDAKSHLTRLYSGSIMSIPHMTGTLDFYDLTQADWKNPDTTVFNFETELL